MSKDLPAANKSRRRSDQITLSQVAQAAGFPRLRHLEH